MSDELCREVDGRAFWPQTVSASVSGWPAAWLTKTHIAQTERYDVQARSGRATPAPTIWASLLCPRRMLQASMGQTADSIIKRSNSAGSVAGTRLAVKAGGENLAKGVGEQAFFASRAMETRFWFLSRLCCA